MIEKQPRITKKHRIQFYPGMICWQALTIDAFKLIDCVYTPVCHETLNTSPEA